MGWGCNLNTKADAKIVERDYLLETISVVKISKGYQIYRSFPPEVIVKFQFDKKGS
jgi:hypothetical protein